KYLDEHGSSSDNDDELREALDQADARAAAAEQAAEAKDAELAQLRAQLAAAQATPAGVDDDAEEEDDADDEDEFSTMNGKELKAYAKENNVSIAGMTKVGEVRAALRASKA